MDRNLLLHQLALHRPFDSYEAGFLKRTEQFVKSTPQCFLRSNLSGHVTGSAWIVSPDRTSAILLHHQKLNRWFQPGGHADGESDILKVAMNEALEETGLSAHQLKIVNHSIFDIDVHRIPARANEPAHDHFDIRYLFEASPSDPLPGNPESHAVEWFALNQVRTMNNTASCHRMVVKTRHLMSR